MRIQHNIAALNAYRNLTTNNNAVSKNLEKLSSGYRINRAGDDAAGLAISEKMRAQITGLETAQKNANDGISLVQTAEGALTEVHSMLNRMVELANQSANGTYANAVDRESLQEEIQSLTDEINRISESTNFNGIKLLDGTLGLNTDSFKIGATKAGSDAGELTGAALGVEVTHAGDSATEVQPEFTINLADFKVKAESSTLDASTTVTVKVSIGGQEVKFYAGTASITDKDAATSDVTVTIPDKATAAVDNAFTKTNFGTKAAVIGNDVYTVQGTGTNEVKFTYVGRIDENGKFVDKGEDGGKVAKDAWIPQGNVDITFDGSEDLKKLVKVTDGRKDCNVTKLKDPVAGETAVRAGASLKLTQDIIDAGSLKIGDTTFKFDKTVPATTGAPKDASSTVTIGIKDVKEEDLLKTVTSQMSNYTKSIMLKDGTKTGTTENQFAFTIGRGNGIDTIEIEESVKTGTPPDYGKFTEAKLQEAFTQTREATAASSSITLAKQPAAGESIQINGKTYTFGEGDNDIKIGATAEESAKNLVAALAKDSKITAEANGATIKVSSTVTGAKSEAPVIGSAGLTLQVGDTSEDFNQLTVQVSSMDADALGIGSVDISTQGGAKVAVDKIKNAINMVSSQRGKLGAIQNRLEHTINNLSVTAENITAAESRIRDVDVAEEMMAYTKNNILVQSAQAMLAQANQIPQGVLQLLQ